MLLRIWYSDINGIVKAILEIQDGKCLFVGKIVDVSRVSFFWMVGGVFFFLLMTRQTLLFFFRKLELDLRGVRSVSRNCVKMKSNTYPIVWYRTRT